MQLNSTKSERSEDKKTPFAIKEISIFSDLSEYRAFLPSPRPFRHLCKKGLISTRKGDIILSSGALDERSVRRDFAPRVRRISPSSRRRREVPFDVRRVIFLARRASPTERERPQTVRKESSFTRREANTFTDEIIFTGGRRESSPSATIFPLFIGNIGENDIDNKQYRRHCI